MYLTGSSTWIFLSLVTQVFGVRGENGNLILNPKLSDWFFDEDGNTGIECTFQNKRIKITYNKKPGLSADQCNILEVKTGNELLFIGQSKQVQIDHAYIRSFDKDLLYIEVSLG